MASTVEKTCRHAPWLSIRNGAQSKREYGAVRTLHYCNVDTFARFLHASRGSFFSFFSFFLIVFYRVVSTCANTQTGMHVACTVPASIVASTTARQVCSTLGRPDRLNSSAVSMSFNKIQYDAVAMCLPVQHCIRQHATTDWTLIYSIKHMS